MGDTARKSDPKLWERVKDEVTRGSKGGKPNQWSARKAQFATAEYKRQGGGYDGPKGSDNHLAQWTNEEWGTKSGEPSGETGERYLPKEAREALSDGEYRETTAKKRADTRAGRQFSRQPHAIAKNTARLRGGGPTKADLMKEARRRDVRGRSSMTKAELETALS